MLKYMTERNPLIKETYYKKSKITQLLKINILLYIDTDQPLFYVWKSKLFSILFDRWLYSCFDINKFINKKILPMNCHEISTI